MLEMEEIYKEYSKTVYRYLISKTRDPDISEELTQETFYQAVKGAERFDGTCKVSTWLCAIAKNQLLAYRRKHPPVESIEEDSAMTDSPEKEVLSGIAHVELLRKLHGFDDPQREVMYLRLFGSLSFREIGSVLGKSENWARVTFYRGKERLRKEIGSDGE